MFARIWRASHPAGKIGVFCECCICGRVRQSPLRSSISAMLPVVLLVAAASWPSLAAERMTVDASPAAVLQRFIVSQQEAGGWPVETIEIEASLPKLNKTGRLRAIRRLLPAGHPNYKVLETAGDPTVKNQVILRYLSADIRATELPGSSVALTPANYRIRHLGTLRIGNHLLYVFRLTPHKKREGLVNGVLWLDSETALLVRESGYLARSPSLLIKRVNLTRENEVLHSAVEARITHLSIETRLVGEAHLVIVERPASNTLSAASQAAEGR